jgi:hypothetical protein
LKAGIDGKTIEKLYIIYNNFKIINNPILFAGFNDMVARLENQDKKGDRKQRNVKKLIGSGDQVINDPKND